MKKILQSIILIILAIAVFSISGIERMGILGGEDIIAGALIILAIYSYQEEDDEKESN